MSQFRLMLLRNGCAICAVARKSVSHQVPYRFGLVDVMLPTKTSLVSQPPLRVSPNVTL